MKKILPQTIKTPAQQVKITNQNTVKTPVKTLFESNLSLPLIQKGKVRDIYDIDTQRMLIVTTDRLSARGNALPLKWHKKPVKLQTMTLYKKPHEHQ